MKKTLVVNLFGGPGIGKSTLAASIFADLKKAGESVELVTEVAKDLTWSSRRDCLNHQPYIFGKQLHRLERLVGKVDIIVTDSPILLSIIYNKHYPPSFNQSCLDIFRSFHNFNVHICRAVPYNKSGRNETFVEAQAIDEIIRRLLTSDDVCPNCILGYFELNPRDLENYNLLLEKIKNEVKSINSHLTIQEI